MNRVLIINDSRFERLFLKDMVIALGFEASATDEYGSLRQVENLLPEMIIVNYTMNGLTGDKLISSIKSSHPEVKCLLSSCSQLNPAQFPQVDGVLQTPVDKEKLQQQLQKLMPSAQVVKDDKKDMTEPPNKTGHKYQFCPFCGENLEVPGIVFCPYCGKKLT